MTNHCRIVLIPATFATIVLVLNSSSACWAQVRRYEPSRPTVSPYLNLFRNDFNRGLPNYYTYVRPMEQQYRVNQQQQRLLQQQNQEINQLRDSLQAVERRQAEGPLVAPTGGGSWFGRPSARSSFMNTSRYYRQSGPAAAR